MRTLFTSTLAALAGLALCNPGNAAEPRLLAEDAISAVLIDGGRAVLYHDNTLNFHRLDLASGAVEPWVPDWHPADEGMSLPEAGTSYPNLAASPDGSVVAIATYVEFANSDPAADWPHVAYALVLCASDGSDARLAALVEATDGGPRLDFTSDGHYLINAWFLDCAPSVAGYHAWLNAAVETTDDSGEWTYPNALDLASGELVRLESLAETEWGVEKSPYSDWYFYEDLETPARFFHTLSDRLGGRYAVWTPANDDEYFFRTQWVGPEHLLAWSDAGQRVVSIDGSAWTAQGGLWEHYCLLPDGRSFFSRDAGLTLELGRIDWRSGQVADSVARPELAHFATIVTEYGWPERVDAWLALPDSSGAVVNTPGIDGGKLFFVSAGV